MEVIKVKKNYILRGITADELRSLSPKKTAAPLTAGMAVVTAIFCQMAAV